MLLIPSVGILKSYGAMCVAVWCCSMLQCVAVPLIRNVTIVKKYGAARVLQCGVAVCCSEMQCH